MHRAGATAPAGAVDVEEGDPIAFPYKTQAVVAVLLMHREGTGPWPVCG